MKALAVFGGIVSVTILMAIRSIFNGYVLSVLWGWFIAPTLGVPQLSVVPAIGIAVVVNYLNHEVYFSKEEEERSLSERIARGAIFSFTRTSFTLFFGWIVHLFM